MKDIANMDQTLLPFVMDDGKTYPDKGSSEVWYATYGSGLDKEQCSVQLAIFANGKPRMKLLVIFRGKGLRIKSLGGRCMESTCASSVSRKGLVRQTNNVRLDFSTME